MYTSRLIQFREFVACRLAAIHCMWANAMPVTLYFLKYDSREDTNHNLYSTYMYVRYYDTFRPKFRPMCTYLDAASRWRACGVHITFMAKRREGGVARERHCVKRVLSLRLMTEALADQHLVLHD